MNSFLSLIDVGLAADLYTKFGTLLGLSTIKQDVLFYPKEIAQRERAERVGDNVLEFISYWRVQVATDWERARTPLARRGISMPYEDESGDTQTIVVRTVPVKMSYMVWFWTKKKDVLNQIIETYLLWQQTDPNLSLLYQDTYPLELDLHFGDIIDESVVAEQYDKGMYFVHSMPIEVEGWAFISTDPTNNIINTIYLSCFDKDDIETYTELIEQSDDYDATKAVTLKLFDKTITE
jgi:hypothetical protein